MKTKTVILISLLIMARSNSQTDKALAAIGPHRLGGYVALAAKSASVFDASAGIGEARAADNGRFAVSINTLGVVSLNPTLEIEYAVASSWSLAATAWYEVRDVRDRWAQLRLSWFPGGTLERGWGFSMAGGVHRAYPEAESVFAKANDTAPTVGVLAHYSWRMGKSGRTFINLTVGGKKCISERAAGSPLQTGYAEGRVNIGRIF